MAEVIFFQKMTCGGNARQRAALAAAGHVVTPRDLLAEAWTAETLLPFLEGLAPADWFNRAAKRVKEGEVVPEALDHDAAIALLLQDPALIRRPLIESGGRRMVGWNAAAIQEWLGLTDAGGAVGESCPRHQGGHGGSDCQGHDAPAEKGICAA